MVKPGKAITYFLTYIGLTNKFVPSKFCHLGWYRYFVWPMDYKEIGDKQKLQDDIDKLGRWSEKWQMLFNFGKCKCLNRGPGNTGMNYEMVKP